jgi:hypothetical protein
MKGVIIKKEKGHTGEWLIDISGIISQIWLLSTCVHVRSVKYGVIDDKKKPYILFRYRSCGKRFA